jgi:3-oxoacyl-[acyl-carrier-protein] synthase II
MKKRVVITGIGISTSNGRSREEFRQSLYNGVDGFKPISPDRFPTEANCYANKSACTIDQDYYEELRQEDDTILTLMAARVIEEALADARLKPGNVPARRAGMFLATTIGGAYPFLEFTRKRLQGSLQRDDFDLLFRCSTPTLSGNLARRFNFRGAVSTISTACAAGTNSIGRGFDLIADGRLDVAVSGGIDVFSELTFSGFNSLQALSKSLCQPFDQRRDGLTLGDASAFVVLESLESARRRNVPIYAEIKGYSANNEAYHPTAPKPDGSTACLTMRQALEQGGIDSSEVEYINAHGTATPANDGMEINGIRQLMGGKPVYVSSTKSLNGHTLGAAGSLELIATVLGMHHGFIPPSANVPTPLTADDDAIRLVRGKAIDRPFRTALSNSFGFGGCMASIAVQQLPN